LTGRTVDEVSSGGGVQVSTSGEVAEVDLDEESAVIDAVNAGQLGEGLLDVRSGSGGGDSLELNDVESHRSRVEQDGILSSSSSLHGGDDDVLVSSDFTRSPDEDTSGWVEGRAWGSVDDGVSDGSRSSVSLGNKASVSSEGESAVEENGAGWWECVQSDWSLVGAWNDLVEHSDLSPLTVVQASKSSVLRIDESLE